MVGSPTPPWIFTVDPGGTTGWSWWEPDGLIPSSGQKTPEDFTDFATEMLTDAARPGVLVIERFTINAMTAKKSPQLDAVEQIGVLKYLRRRLSPETELVFQLPSEAMGLLTDKRLRKLSWYKKGEVHANDALRHLGFYMARNRLLTLPTE